MHLMGQSQGQIEMIFVKLCKKFLLFLVEEVFVQWIFYVVHDFLVR